MSGEGPGVPAARSVSEGSVRDDRPDDDRPDDAGAATAEVPVAPPAGVRGTPGDGYPRGFSHPSAPAALLRQLGLRPRKGLSQSFLTDVGVTRAIADAARLGPDDAVLEVGPGLGILTLELARRVRRVVAFELDRDLAAALPRLLPPHVQVVRGDALQLDPAAYLAPPYKVVANLPYQITSPFLFRYLGLQPAPTVLVLMVQREVAERVAAPVGDLSYLAVAVQSAASVRLVRLVAPGSFYPRPRVESAVLRLDPLAEPPVPADERASFLQLVRAGFGQPRKQLLNSLQQGLAQAGGGPDAAWPRDEVRRLLDAAGIAGERRPQELTLDEWRRLYRASRRPAGG